jgi:hypothetical protein
MTLFAVRIHVYVRDTNSRFSERIEAVTGEIGAETGGAAVRAFCALMNIKPEAGFSFEEIKEKRK